MRQFQRSRLTFDLSVKVAHIGVALNIVFSESTKPIDGDSSGWGNKSLFNHNQKADDLGTWYVASKFVK